MMRYIVLLLFLALIYQQSQINVLRSSCEVLQRDISATHEQMMKRTDPLEMLNAQFRELEKGWK